MHIAFDADDTLWHNEPIFELTQERVARMLADWVPAEVLGEKLARTERRNLRLFGYGANPSGNDNNFGQEIDIVTTIKIYKGVTMSGGYAHLLGGDVIEFHGNIFD